MAGAVLTGDRIEQLIQAIDRLENYADVAELIPLLVK